jgi:IS30 family transposase
MKYKQLTIEERELLKERLIQKASLRSIACELKRSPSSITREIKRNGRSYHYSPYQANQRALIRRKSRGRKLRLKNDFIRDYVVVKLKHGWSPEQISGRLKLDSGKKISHETIYQYIYSQVYRNGWGELKPGREDLRPYLKRRHKRRVKKGLRGTQRIGKLPGKSIDLRPKVVTLRKRFGDWEGDAVVSRQSLVGLNTLVERKSGYVLITKIQNSSAKETSDVTIHRLKVLPKKLRRTITWDNGKENSNIAVIEQCLSLDCYLAHPYHSWERGTNENTNGLVRWYLPKKTDFAKITDEEILCIENELNNRPRKRLGYKTPLEVINQSVALNT